MHDIDKLISEMTLEEKAGFARVRISGTRKKLTVLEFPMLW